MKGVGILWLFNFQKGMSGVHFIPAVKVAFNLKRHAITNEKKVCVRGAFGDAYK